MLTTHEKGMTKSREQSEIYLYLISHGKSNILSREHFDDFVGLLF